MLAEDFYQEVLSSEICPQNFKEIYTEFVGYQQDAYKTLVEFHRVCEKNGIRYQLAFGSLLGAIRDNGMIPWDYDVDVLVPYSEKEALISALKADLNEDYYFVCPDVDKNCRHYLMRIAPKTYDSKLLHVDVFFLIGLPDSVEIQKKTEKLVHFLFYVRYIKKVNIQDMKNVKRKIKIIGLKFLYALLPMRIVDKLMDNACSANPFATSNYFTPVFKAYNHLFFRKEEMWPAELLKIGDDSFRVPQLPERILSQVYGDYMKIYPLNSRLNELIGNYNKLANKNVEKSGPISSGRYYVNRK